MTNSTVTDISDTSKVARISTCKTAARGVNTAHSSLFFLCTSLTNKGAFYVNCAFNWIAGMALGGWLLALGAVFNDFSMKDYWHRIKNRRVYPNDMSWCWAGLVITGANTLLCLALCFFMLHEKASNTDFVAISALKAEISQLEKGMEMSKEYDQETNWAETFQLWKKKNSALTEATFSASENNDYAPQHAIFEKLPWLDQMWCTVFMCFAIFANAMISAWIEREETTVDDIDENGYVRRGDGGWLSRLRRSLFGKDYIKPVMTTKSDGGPA